MTALDATDVISGDTGQDSDLKSETANKSAEKQFLLNEQTYLLYKNQPLTLLSNIIFGFFVIVAYWNFEDQQRLTAWFLTLVVTTGSLAFFQWRYNRIGRNEDPRIWARYFLLGMVVTGVVWGSTVFLLSLDSVASHDEFLLFMVAGLTTGAITSAASYIPAVIAFIVPALVPIAFHYLLGNNETEVFMGLIILFAVVLIIRLSLNAQSVVIRSTTLRYRNSSLVTSLEARKQELHEKSIFLQAVLDNIMQGVCVYDKDMRLAAWNEAFLDFLKAPEGWVRMGRPLEDFLRFKAARGEYGPGATDELVSERIGEISRSKEIQAHQYERTLPDGREVEVRGDQMPGGGIVTTYTDITERKRALEEINHIAHHDPLTGLPNRMKFRKTLEQALSHAERNSTVVGVMMLDLDHFKDVNDNMGHPAGDELLKIVAQRLKNCVRKTDTVARLGGDEFAVIGTNQKDFVGAPMMAKKIIDVLQKPITLQGKPVQVGASIGITVHPNDKGGVDQLISNADLALYRAKNEGRNRYRLFDKSMQAEVQERQALANDIRVGLEFGQFQLHYQPQINLKTGSMIGVEALSRWKHPERGAVPPTTFIPVAESTRLIGPLSEWLLAEACSQGKKWEEKVNKNFLVAVNISPIHFKSGELAKVVESTLEKTGLSPGNLELEITEGSFLDARTVAHTLARLEEIGVRLAIDDFGTGYSSMSYLKMFPVHKLKIDRSFVSDVNTDTDSEAIVDAIIKLAHSLNLTVIAEGVETAEQLVALREMGCDEVQGFYFSKAVPVAQLNKLLQSPKIGDLVAAAG